MSVSPEWKSEGDRTVALPRTGQFSKELQEQEEAGRELKGEKCGHIPSASSPEDDDIHNDRCENLKCCMKYFRISD
jgi:hypothetical protein